MRAPRDIREHIAALEECGEAIRVEKEVDWNLEAGALTRLSNERRLPAPFFQKIKGYSSDYRIFAAPMASYKRVAVAMGLDPNISLDDLVETYRARVKERIKPLIVDTGPCKENILMGDDINLFKFPAPMVHEGDGGRYLFTWHLAITKDLDTDWQNWGMYRGMIHSKDVFSGLVEKQQHIGYQFHNSYKPRRVDMPFAYVIAPDPVSTFAACTKQPKDVNEAEIAGALRQEPVELVKCETNDLLVPANAEIVVEGEISATKTVWEGPFGEFSGYRASPRDKRPVFKVKAITHRNNPILTMSCMGVPMDDCHITMCLADSVNIAESVRRAGVPGLKDVWVPPECAHFLTVASVKTYHSHMAQRVATSIWGCEQGNTMPWIIVVEDDVDVRNMAQVMHALATKCHPFRGVNTLERAHMHTLTPFMDRSERLAQKGAKTYFDCLWPIDWDPSIAVPPRASFAEIYPEEVQKHVLENLESYGYKKP